MATKRVLLAEGNVSDQQVIAGLIKALDVEVDVVATCPEAIKAARMHDYAVIFANLNVDDILSGIKRMRSALNETPVVVFSANSTANDKDKAKEVGANEFVSKMLDNDEIKRLIGHWIYREEKWLD